MSKTTKTMWLRRVSQLGLAGALLMPLSLSSSEAAAQAEKNIKDAMIYSEVLGSDHCPIGLEIN